MEALQALKAAGAAPTADALSEATGLPVSQCEQMLAGARKRPADGPQLQEQEPAKKQKPAAKAKAKQAAKPKACGKSKAKAKTALEVAPTLVQDEDSQQPETQAKAVDANGKPLKALKNRPEGNHQAPAESSKLAEPTEPAAPTPGQPLQKGPAPGGQTALQQIVAAVAAQKSVQPAALRRGQPNVLNLLATSPLAATLGGVVDCEEETPPLEKPDLKRLERWPLTMYKF